MNDVVFSAPPEELYHPATTETPVTMERAFSFGIRIGFGIIAAQAILGLVVGILYVVVRWTMPGR